jgi:hypothetical protein
MVLAGLSALPMDESRGIGLWIGAEATAIPTPAASVRTSDRCYGVRKTENTNLSPVLPRPRVLLTLPRGVSVEASYLPPVTVAGATPNLAAAAISWAPALGRRGRWGIALRAHGTLGHLDGPITCSSSSIQLADAGRPCYGRAPSDDRFTPNLLGAEGAVRWRPSPRLALLAGAGYTRVASRFAVNFVQAQTDQAGRPVVDDTRIEVALNRVPVFAGLAWRARPALELQAQAYSVPQDLTTVRLGALYRLR